MSTASTRMGGEKTVNQKVGLVFGIIYILVGLSGFLVTGDVPFIGKEGNPLIVFNVNGLHNVVHLLIGLALAGAAASSASASRSINMTVGVVYLALGLLGWFITDTALNIVALNAADHVLHLVSGALLIAVARAMFGSESHARTA